MPTFFDLLSPDERKALIALKTAKTIEEKTGLQPKAKPRPAKKAA